MQHPTQTTQTPPGRVLHRRNSRGAAMTTKELTSRPPGTEERPMTPERTYTHVVSPAPATLPKPADASTTIGGDIARTPNQGDRPARVYMEKLPQGTDSRTHLQVEVAEDKDGPWTVATGRTARTHRESIGSRKSSPADRVSIEVDQARGQIEDITSIVDEAAASMSPEVLRLIADRYASLASAVEQRTPAPRPESLTDTTPESKDESEAIGGAAEKSDAKPGPDDSPDSEPEGSDGHPYHLGEAEWSKETQEPETPLAGPSRDKGKGPDPGNWGGINISESELEYQRDAWKAFELAHEEQDKGKHRQSPVVTPVERGHPPGGSAPLSRDATSVKGEEMGAAARDQGVFMRKFKRMRERLAELEERESLRKASRPAASPVESPRLASAEIFTPPRPKIVKKRSTSKTKPNGFVTSMLRGVSLQPSDDSGSSPDPSSGDSDSKGGPTDSSSGESGSEYGSSDSSSDSDSSDSDSSGPRSKKKPSKKKKKSSKPARGKMLVKPNPPACYDGSENADLYTQSFLDGDAKDFYNRRIRGQEHKWTLKKMLRRLLKYCFSLDYRQKQRKRLNRCHQNGKSVNKHVLELESILLQIGLKKDRERVALLWNSFDADIQEELFRFGLDPEKSRWKRVVKKAVRAERFLSLDRRRKGKATAVATTGVGPGQHGQDQEEKRRRFFPRKQGGIIKAAAATVEPPRESGPRPAARYPSAVATASPLGKAQNTPDRPWEQRLSPQKRAELMARGVCLNCEESGHMARSCPKLTSMKSKVKGKPPGFGAHGVSLRTASLGKTTEVFEALNVASASWFEVRDNGEVLEQLLEASGLGSSDWEETAGTDHASEGISSCGLSCPEVEALAGELEALSLGPGPSTKWKPDLGPIDRSVRLVGEASEPSELVGDLAARFASMVLQRCAPFPGDDGSEPTEGRFLVYRVKGTDYHCILDCGTPLSILEGDELIPSSCLEDADFELGWHWAQKCYLAQGIHPDAPGLLLPDRYFCALGDSILAMTLILLQTYGCERPNEEVDAEDASLFEGLEGLSTYS
ncbi:unnamed protein product [Mycena citricolor]|uniref:CCHC-type domain-containing protein n=1 Tax=Mycena citricolor TaxID=2018698 RepID=A0AAD2JXV2_9AGAR|nr:unnamed protein product [Mycena citricolor]